MNILAIIGSPKGKGTGYRIARRIEGALQTHEPVSMEYLFLKERDLRPCRGCFLCVTRGEERCPLKDDRTALEEKIDGADGIILVSPCYVSSVSGLMKNFMDRMCYTNHRPRFFRQKLFLVANGGAGMEETLQTLRRTLGSGPRVAAELAYITPPWPLASRVEAKQERRLVRKTAAFHRAIQRDRARGGLPLKPSFSEYLTFRFFKKISLDTREYLTADHRYYRGLTTYYHDARIGPLKRIAAFVALAVGMVMMRDLSPAPAASPASHAPNTPASHRS